MPRKMRWRNTAPQNNILFIEKLQNNIGVNLNVSVVFCRKILDKNYKKIMASALAALTVGSSAGAASAIGTIKSKSNAKIASAENSAYANSLSNSVGKDKSKKLVN
jgi:hypothetical protein